MTSNGGQGGTLALLICRVGSRLCGIPLEHVVETMRPLPVEPLSHLPGFVDGLSLIRGRPTPVLDAHRLLGADGGQKRRARYVTIRLGRRNAALAVDAVLGVRHVAAAELADLPGLLREPRNELVQALGMLDHELLVVLERSRLLPESVWETLDAEARRT
jgi:purine-binding chemotaxis protein CheW